MKKALAWSLSICAAVAGLALSIPGAAAAAPAGTGAADKSPVPLYGRLAGVVAVNARDIWTVGLDYKGSLIMNWNGVKWTEYEPTKGYGFFQGVAQSSARDVWAVGGSSWFSPTQTFAWHWNGSHWNPVATPNPPGGGYFNAIDETSSRNAWAVGLAGGGPGAPSSSEPLVERWNGKTWTIQNVQLPADGGQFTGVSATSPSNAWAVGWTGPSSAGASHPLIEHWNGKTWTQVAAPSAGFSSYLQAVTAISSDNAWAVGYSTPEFDASNTNTLAMHWDGRSWSKVVTATPDGDAQFLGVTASWSNNIWAVGYRDGATCGGDGTTPCQTVIEHWNGVHFKVVQNPNPPAGKIDLLSAIVAVSRTDIWAVGSRDWALNLIEHWNGSSWSAISSPNL